MSVAEWTDAYGIYHWRILWNSYRKLAWVGFEPTTTEFRSDALTDWAIRPTLGKILWYKSEAHRINLRLTLYLEPKNVKAERNDTVSQFIISLTRKGHLRNPRR